ncbi:MAG TPA: Ig-like domain-containing protein, partial [Micromonosporaceae bacterium]
MSRLLTTRPRLALCAAAVIALAVALPAAASATSPNNAGAHTRVTLFPSNSLTVGDGRQLTGRRVALPLPDCTTHLTDCNTIRELNTLDGFDIDPQLALTFTSPVDATAVAARTTLSRVGDGSSASIGVDRVVYDATTNTVYAHPIDQLAPDTTYALRLRGDSRLGIPEAHTTFTTESATIDLLDIRKQLDSGLAYIAA